MKKLEEKLALLGDNFEKFLYESNPNTVKSLKNFGLNEDEIRRTELFDWFQGVGLYGYYKLYKETADEKYLNILRKYFDNRIDDGLPKKNVNSMAPMLTLINLVELDEKYDEVCLEWATWLFEKMPRTKVDGFQHITLDGDNEGELWDDTLFMSVLFMIKAGLHYNNNAWVEEGIYQFYIHTKYLVDTKTGLWFHGYTSVDNSNFIEALWARGNSWITIFIPEVLDYLSNYKWLTSSTVRFMTETLVRQVETLIEYQHESGLWHTLINDRESYLESSATAGFAYGMLKAINMQIIPDIYIEPTLKALNEIMNLIDDQGVLGLVSGGTAMGKDSLDFYRNIPLVPKPYGQAMAMLALIEYKKYLS